MVYTPCETFIIVALKAGQPLLVFVDSWVGSITLWGKNCGGFPLFVSAQQLLFASLFS